MNKFFLRTMVLILTIIAPSTTTKGKVDPISLASLTSVIAKNSLTQAALMEKDEATAKKL